MSKTQVNWTISGMTCSGCAHSASIIAMGHDGISNVQVRYANGIFKATVDTSVLNTHLLEEDLKNAGYTLEREYLSPAKKVELARTKLKDLKWELIFSSLFALPLLVLGMLHIEYLWSIMIQGVLAVVLSFYFGRRIHKKAWKLLKSGATNMDTLVSLGSISAFLLSVFNIIVSEGHQSYFESAGLIVFFILVGKFIEERGKFQNGKALLELIALQPQYAWKVTGDELKKVHVDSLEVGDAVLIKVGELIPVDGMVTDGVSTIDESTFTGEPIPVDKKVGDIVWAGTLNGEGSLTISVEKTGSTSAIGSLIETIAQGQSSEAPIESLTQNISKVFVPTIIALSLVVGLIWLINDEPRALIFAINVLVIACPCALGLATPLAVVAANGAGADIGIIIKKAAALQYASSVKYALLDKTGTLTIGKPIVKNISWTTARNIELLTALNSRGNHPLNTALNSYLGSSFHSGKVNRFKAIPGKGIQGKFDGEIVYLGSPKWYSEVTGGSWPETQTTTSLLFSDSAVIASINFEDVVRPEAIQFIQQLKEKSIEPVILSGDSSQAVAKIAFELGIKKYHGEMLPIEKAKVVQSYQEDGPTLFIGDGINDTVALQQAAVGVSLAHATAAAQENADVVLSREGLIQLNDYFRLSKSTMTTIYGNLFWAFGYNIIAIPLAAGVLYPTFGISLTPMMASIAMSISSLGVVGNSLLLKKRMK